MAEQPKVKQSPDEELDNAALDRVWDGIAKTDPPPTEEHNEARKHPATRYGVMRSEG